MKAMVLNINDTDVTPHPVVYICYGLGSCIGLFLTDRTMGLTAGAHIPLPTYSYSGAFLGANQIIDQLLTSLAQQGSDLNCLRAKITGGAQMFESSSDIGARNAEAVLNQLVAKKIFIAATDFGGKISRTARFNSITGKLEITTSEQKMYFI
jgi:chemotaxis protein CheD